MPEPIKPLYTRFPRREDMGKKARMMTPAEQADMEKATNELDAELKVILDARPAGFRIPGRPFGGAVPPLVLPPVPPVPKPAAAAAKHVQTGGFGRISAPPPRPAPPAAATKTPGAPKRVWGHIDPNDIPF
jgi:hypothetical protein